MECCTHWKQTHASGSGEQGGRDESSSSHMHCRRRAHSLPSTGKHQASPGADLTCPPPLRFAPAKWGDGGAAVGRMEVDKAASTEEAVAEPLGLHVARPAEVGPYSS
jgi:hypothetical protein